jgi:hypothetical protein
MKVATGVDVVLMRWRADVRSATIAALFSLPSLRAITPHALSVTNYFLK